MAFNVPIVQEVTSTEALQSGLQGKRELSPAEKEKVNRFIQAHVKVDQDKAPEEIDGQKSTTAPIGDAQVSAEEQASAVVLRGIARRIKKTKTSKNIRLYKLLYTRDPSFLDKDMQFFKRHLSNKSKTLVDLSTNLSAREKGLRHFLLASIFLEQDDLDKSEIGAAQSFKNSVYSEFKEFIDGTLSAFETGLVKKMPGASLQEFIKGYGLMEFKPDSTNNNLLNLFKQLKKNAGNDEKFKSAMTSMRDGFIALLSREITQSPTRITTPRHHIILSTINQINTLIKVQGLHHRFLDCCQKARLQGLPSLNNLLEACLQAVTSVEMLVGINTLVRMATVVSGSTGPSKNIFMTNYLRLVLKSNTLMNLFKSELYQKQFTDSLNKQLLASEILSIKASQND
ncbi:MAG TPA: hypothetical protein VFX23_15000 [Limnobacter sp.]|uniref:hypothetical protein n=1 Tax=Limnobacter sp. TaxID=2003368 RepID=UPI002E37F49D|nr:hypothetical protein [Limnobacter sp.]HEX5487293.1 hypothetical protein [Limnobacter sp.]